MGALEVVFSRSLPKSGVLADMFSAKKITLLTLLAAVGASGVLWMDFDPSTVSNAAPATTEAPAVGAKTPAKPAAAKDAKDKDDKPAAKAPEPDLTNAVTVTPDELVGKPQEYLGKNVKFTANFFAFSNLALDYKPAFRSSKTHLSLLVLKPGTHVPLSELKLAMMIPKDKDPETELLAKLKDGDQVEIIGKQYSTALDDPWVEVFKLKKIGGSKDETKKAAADKTDAKTEKTDKTEDK
jgi:hypothetical protein